MRRVALCVLTAALALRAEPPAGLIPPGAKAVIGIRLERLAALTKDLIQSLPATGQGWMRTTKAAGVNPIENIEEMIIATDGQPSGGSTLVVASGRFGAAPPEARDYHGVPMLAGAANDGAIAILDSATAVMGDPEWVRWAIDSRGRAADAGTASRIADLRARYDVWGFGEVPAGLAGNSPAPGMGSIDRFEFGMAMADGLKLAAELRARSADDANKLLASLRLLEFAVKAQKPEMNGVTLDLQARDNSVRIEMHLPEAELRKAVAGGRAPLAGAFGRGGANLPAASAGRPPASSAAPAAAPVRPSYAAAPGTTVTDARGDTLIVGLPGKRQ